MSGKITINELESRLRDNPKSLLFAHLADLYLRAGRIEDAIYTCDEGLKHHTAYVSGYFVLAKAHMASSQPDKAESALKTILTHDRQYLSAHKLLGDIMARDGWENKAAVHYRDLLRIDPLEMEARDMLGSIVDEEEPLGAFASHEIGWDGLNEETAVEKEPAEQWEEELNDLSSLEPVPEDRASTLDSDTPTETAPGSAWLEEDISLDDVPNLAGGATLQHDNSAPLADEAAMAEAADDIASDALPRQTHAEDTVVEPTEPSGRHDKLLSTLDWPEDAPPLGASTETQADPANLADAVEAHQLRYTSDLAPDNRADIDLPSETSGITPEPAQDIDDILNNLAWPEGAAPENPADTEATKAATTEGPKTADDKPAQDIDDFLNNLAWPEGAAPESPTDTEATNESAAGHADNNWSLEENNLADASETLQNSQEKALFKEADFELDMTEETLSRNPLFNETPPAEAAPTAPALFEDSVEALPFEETGKPNIISPTLGEIYTAQGQYAKAIKVYETLLEKQPNEKIYLNKINELQKKLDEA